MKRLEMTATAIAFLLLAGCGRGEERAGQPSAEESEKLDNIAGKLEGTDTFDTSPDSKVPAEEPAATNEAAPPPANQAAPAPAPTTANAAGPN